MLPLNSLLRLLTQRYGDTYRIIAAYRYEIKHWLQIKAGDADAYQKFQNFLVKLENIGHLQSQNVLDTPDIMFMLDTHDCQSYQAVLETDGLEMS